jgi:hypothetical protein
MKTKKAFEKLKGVRLDEIDLPLIDSWISRRRGAGREVSTISR